MRGHGVKVTIIEPGGFATDWRGPSSIHAEPLPAYDDLRAMVVKMAGSFPSGDPQATGPAILKIVDAAEPPLRVFFGPVGLPMIRAEYAQRIAGWEAWNDVSIAAQGEPKATAASASQD